MTGVYANITQQDPAVVERMAAAHEVRNASPSQRAMREAYFAEINFPKGALVLEVGCGTGAVSRALAVWPNVAEVIGIDPSPDFIAKAKELAAQLSNVAFHEGDGRSLDRADASVDVVEGSAKRHQPAGASFLARNWRNKTAVAIGMTGVTSMVSRWWMIQRKGSKAT